MFNPFFNLGQIFVLQWLSICGFMWKNVCCKSVQLLLSVIQIICKMTLWTEPPAIFCFLYFRNGEDSGFCPLRVTVSVIILITSFSFWHVGQDETQNHFSKLPIEIWQRNKKCLSFISYYILPPLKISFLFLLWHVYPTDFSP